MGTGLYQETDSVQYEHVPSRKASRKPNTLRKRVVGNKRAATPRTAEQFFSAPERVQETLRRVTDVIAKMRKEHLSLRAAAWQAGISPRTVLHRAGSVIRRGSNGRYTAKPGDQLLRVLKIATPDGLREIGVRGSRQASALGQYAAAVERYLSTGDFAPLAQFSGKGVRDDKGNMVTFLTDRVLLKKLASAGELSYESIYARV
jgi:hypothetical protein